MLSPRYHLVTIVAIFLALGLGLLAGSSFGQPTLVGQLQERTESQLRRIEELRDDVDVERARADALASYASASASFLIAGRLTGYRVVVVTQEGVPAALESSVLDALETAGAEILATLAAQPSLTGEEAADAEALTALLGAGDAEGTGPYPARAGAALAARLAAPVAPLDPDIDLLPALLGDGFLAARDGALDEPTRLGIHATQFLVVVLGGTEPQGLPLATRPFAEALVRGLSDAALPVAAVEPADAGDAWVDELSTDATVTVIGGDGPTGSGALILGLLDLLRTGDGGAYGGERAPLPPPP